MLNAETRLAVLSQKWRSEAESIKAPLESAVPRKRWKERPRDSSEWGNLRLLTPEEEKQTADWRCFLWLWCVWPHSHDQRDKKKKSREGSLSRQNRISTLSGNIRLKQRKLFNSCVIHSVSGVQGNPETMDMFNNFLWFLIPSSYHHS